MARYFQDNCDRLRPFFDECASKKSTKNTAQVAESHKNREKEKLQPKVL
jgi:hypothetical protein